MLGAPNGNGANFSSSGQYIVIDLIDTVKAGETYSITWRQYPGQSGTSYLNWSESTDGSTFTVHPSSGIGTTNERYFNTDIVASTDTRYIRIFSNSTYDLSIDAISYSTVKCFSNPCGAGYTPRLISGTGYYTEQSFVSNPGNANYVPDGSGATFNSGSDRIVLSLQYAIPAGQTYNIIWRPTENNAQMRIRESQDGSSWTPVKFSSSSASSSVFLIHAETAGTDARFIEIIGANNSDFLLDGITFSAISCDPDAPDLDVDGNFEFCASPVSIAEGLTITDAADQIISSAYVMIGSGYVSSQDRLTFTTAYGITGNFNSNYGVLYLSGEATTSQYQSVLRSVVYNNISGSPTTGPRQIIFSLERYNPDTDHYYRYISNTGISWSNARIQADRTHLFGLQGYLVTVTSDSENDFLLYQMSGNTWIGGSDFFTNESDWYWMTGPEAGTMFWQGEEGGTPFGYANWNPGVEPNNYNGTDEVFAHIYASGSSNAGTWNDESANYSGSGYYVEFGDMPGDPEIDIRGTVSVNVVTGVPVNPAISGPVTVCPNATGQVYSTASVPGHNYFWEVSGGTISGGQGTNSITVNWGATNPGTVKVTESVGGACSVTTPDYSVFIGDIINPTITCPADVLNVPADAGQCYATGVALGSPTTADNCGVATVTNNAPAQFPS
ncbi:MAG: hypothetical protein R2756_13040 [Bacteroidales bacterium]